MWAAVRPGGAIAVEDCDFDGLFCHPPNAGHEFWRHIYRAVLEHNGGDPRVGRKLHGYFLEAGIPAPHMRLTQHVDAAGEAKSLPLLTIQTTADAIRAARLASDDEIGAALESLEALIDDQDGRWGTAHISGLVAASGLAHQHAAVDVERRPGDEARLVGK
jgi:hypothetical protein